MVQPTPNRNMHPQPNPMAPHNPYVFSPRPPGSLPLPSPSHFQMTTPQVEVPYALVQSLAVLDTNSLYQLLGMIYSGGYRNNLFSGPLSKGILNSPFFGDGSSGPGSSGGNPPGLPPPPGGGGPDDPFVKQGKATFLSLREKLKSKICGENGWNYCEKKKKFTESLVLTQALANFIASLLPTVGGGAPIYATQAHTATFAGANFTQLMSSVTGVTAGIALFPIVAGAAVAVLFVKVGLDGYCNCADTLGQKIWKFFFG